MEHEDALASAVVDLGDQSTAEAYPFREKSFRSQENNPFFLTSTGSVASEEIRAVPRGVALYREGSVLDFDGRAERLAERLTGD